MLSVDSSAAVQVEVNEPRRWSRAICSRCDEMDRYKAAVRVQAPSGHSMVTTWAEVRASSPIMARQLLESQFGRGNVVGLPVRCR